MQTKFFFSQLASHSLNWQAIPSVQTIAQKNKRNLN